jgi:hypothetical protein
MSNQAAEKIEDISEDNTTESCSEEEKTARANPIIISRTGLEDEHNIRLRVNVPVEVTPEDCMDEGFWSHITSRLTIGDTIIVRPDHQEWELVLHVANVGREFAHVVQKHLYDLRHVADPKAEASRYSVDFVGTTDKWRFMRDGKVLKSGFASKGLAERAAQNHQMAVDRSSK